LHCLHVHIPRTAGTSLHIWARKRFRDHQYFASWRGCKVKHWKIDRDFDPDASWTSAGHLDRRRMRALLKKQAVTQEWLDKCFKIVWVRNTWDRLLSLWRFYRVRRGRRYMRGVETFEEFLHRCIESKGYDWPGMARSQLNYLWFEPDFEGRYETINRDWTRLLDVLGLPWVRMPHRRTSTRKPKDWREGYNMETRIYVQDHWAEEIERLGYEFD